MVLLKIRLDDGDGDSAGAAGATAPGADSDGDGDDNDDDVHLISSSSIMRRGDREWSPAISVLQMHVIHAHFQDTLSHCSGTHSLPPSGTALICRNAVQ